MHKTFEEFLSCVNRLANEELKNFYIAKDLSTFGPMPTVTVLQTYEGKAALKKVWDEFTQIKAQVANSPLIAEISVRTTLRSNMSSPHHLDFVTKAACSCILQHGDPSIESLPEPDMSSKSRRRDAPAIQPDKTNPPLEADTSKKPKNNQRKVGEEGLIKEKGNPKLIEGRDAVTFRTAELYLGIGPRQRQKLIKDEILNVTGGGQNKKITVKSLLDYLPQENPN